MADGKGAGKRSKGVNKGDNWNKDKGKKGEGTVHVSIRLSFWLAIATRLNWAGRRWGRTLKRTFGISQRCLPLAEPVSVYHVQAKPGAGPIFGTFFGR